MLITLADVVRAIENNEVVPAVQPIVGLTPGKLAGFEVLTRRRHPKHGFVLPVTLSSHVEKNDLVGVSPDSLQQSHSDDPYHPEPLMSAVNVHQSNVICHLPAQIEICRSVDSFP